MMMIVSFIDIVYKLDSSVLSTAISVTMYVEDDEFNEEDGMGLVCVQISAGQLDGITATVALTTSDDSASSPGT